MPNPWEHNPASPGTGPASPELPGKGPLPPPGVFLPTPPEAYKRLGEAPGVSEEAVRLGYEPHRLSVRGLVIFFVLFVFSAAVIHGLVWLLMEHFVNRDRGVDQPRSAFAAPENPAGPRLQPSVGHDTLDYQDLDALRTHEDQVFQKLGWQVNVHTHEVAIPIQIVERVAREERTRAAAPAVPPTTTGRNTNSIVPKGIPKYDTQPDAERSIHQ